jgi:hypothetical protein
MAKTNEPRVNRNRFQPTEKNIVLYFEDMIILPFQKTAGGHQVRPVGCIVAGAKHSQLAFLN